MKKLLFTLALAPALVFARPYTLIIAADGNASWTKTVREHMLPGREAHVHDFGKNTIAETLSSCGWKEFLADINDGDVVLMALGHNGVTTELTQAVRDVAKRGPYIGIVPPWSFDAATFNRDMGLTKR